VSEPDRELREGIIGVLKELQRTKPLREVAETLGASEKTLRRYLNSKLDPPATLGGDILFRLCEAGYSIPCRGKSLKCVDSRSAPKSGVKTEQLRFEFVASLDLLLPSRKLVARVERVNRRVKLA
jgi:hypothetical protein